MTALLCALAQAALLAAPADGAPTPPADPAAAFREAHARYLAGDFEGAALRYQALADAGLTGAALHYDLGNAWFRAGRPGRAAAAWERALRLDPGDAEAEANLRLVRRAYAARPPWSRPEPLAERIAARVSDLAAALAFALPWLGLWAALALRLGARGARRTLASALAALCALLALGGGLLVAARAREQRAPRAVVVVPGAPLLEAPSDALRATLELPEAAPLRALAAEGDYLRVRLPGGVEGFVRKADVELL
ncbi:MAG: tetratricopeptide repeat protein [Deltaproteobacteria bacterium]|nr:tetratricopeptide repeat protein [Deltaproteobacteria bacterium]